MQMAKAGASVGGAAGDGDFTSATYDSAYTLPSAITNVRGIVVSDDETKFLINDISASTNYLTRIELTTAGDLSTASVADTSSIGTGTKFNLFLQSPSIVRAMDVSNDQIRKYQLNNDFGDTISSNTFNNVPAGANTTSADNPAGVTFNDDGSKMFIVDFNADGVQEFSLSTGYDVSTATYTDNGDVSAQTVSPYSQCWNSDGTKMYVFETGAGVSELFQYTLSTAYDVSTKSYDGSLLLDDGVLSGALAFGIVVNSNDNALYVSCSDFTSNFSAIAKYTI
jgi:hypothetical protein